jgi:hypothetical protein
VETFFDTINVWFPILHFSSVTVLLEDYERLSDEDEVLLHAITTATLRFLSKDMMTECEKRSQREFSIRRVKLYVLSHVSIRTAQSLVILSIDAFGVDRMPGLLALLRRQFSMLSCPAGYPSPVTPRSDCSSPMSTFDEQTIDTTMVEPASLECLSRAMQLLEQLCCMITISRTKMAVDDSTASSRGSQCQPANLFTRSLCSNKEELYFEESMTMRESSNALKLMSRVFDFGQVSSQSRRAAAQTEWRKAYAGLHRELTNVSKSKRDSRSSAFIVYDDLYHDNVTAPAIHQA